MPSMKNSSKKYLLFHLGQLLFWLGMGVITLYSMHIGLALYKNLIFLVVIFGTISLSVLLCLINLFNAKKADSMEISNGRILATYIPLLLWLVLLAIGFVLNKS